MAASPTDTDTARMTNSIPFCETCGRVGPSISGFHPNDEGLVRWTLYRCGHVRTDVAPDGVLATADEGQLSTL